MVLMLTFPPCGAAGEPNSIRPVAAFHTVGPVHNLRAHDLDVGVQPFASREFAPQNSIRLEIGTCSIGTRAIGKLRDREHAFRPVRHPAALISFHPPGE
jgi:hypothetical protein